MAGQIHSNAFLEVNGKQLASYATSITANFGTETQDKTTFGQLTRTYQGGLLTHTIDVTFNWDNSTAGPEPTLWAIRGTSACVEYRNNNVCTTVINPSYSGIMTFTGFTGLGGAVGNMLTLSGQFVASGALSRASSS